MNRLMDMNRVMPVGDRNSEQIITDNTFSGPSG